ncbi:MAG: hypothetical protein U1E83_07570 [Methylotetracoccus sp.]
MDFREHMFDYEAPFFSGSEPRPWRWIISNWVAFEAPPTSTASENLQTAFSAKLSDAIGSKSIAWTPSDYGDPMIFIHDFREWCERNGYQPKLLEEFDEFTRTRDSRTDRPVLRDDLPPSERESLLKMVLAMAVGAYGYDPRSDNQKATGSGQGSIKVDADRLGLSLDPKTIRKYLREAVDRLRSKQD